MSAMMATGATGPTPVPQYPAATSQRGHSRQPSSSRTPQQAPQQHAESSTRRETRSRSASQSGQQPPQQQQQQSVGAGGSGSAGYVDTRGSRVAQPTTRVSSGGSANQPRVHAPRPSTSAAPAPSGGQSSAVPGSSPQRPSPSRSRQPEPSRPAPEQPRAQPQSQVHPINRAQAQPQPQPQASSHRPSTAPNPNTPGGSSSRQTQGHQTVTSSFPHAFERWERLSSRWEGLTGYWISRLEHNRQELAHLPLEQEMARQISDLSTAGANLFQAVVELQRLRASSERKFQRWFFDTKADQERAKEMSSELERSLRVERQKRADAVAAIQKLEKDKATAEKLADEMRRELQISKEECRRAWEELGRKEQDEREKTNSLKEGNPTLVGGIQVFPMPMPGVPDRATNRPRTAGSGNTTATPQPMTPQQFHDQFQENEYGREAVADFGGAPLHHGSHISSPGHVPATSTTPATVSDMPTSAYPPSQGRPGSSRQQQQQPEGHPFYQHPHPSLHLTDQPATRTLSPGEESNVTGGSAIRSRESGSVTVSEQSEGGEGDAGWEYDSAGNPTPVQYQRREPSRAEEEEELENWDSYPKYDGTDYDGNDGSGGVAVGFGRGWEGMSRAHHHHPTRLSDVPEEDEERRTHMGSEGGRVSR